MSEILGVAHYIAKDLHEVGAMENVTMRVIDELCLSKPRAFAAEGIKIIRKKASIDQ